MKKIKTSKSISTHPCLRYMSGVKYSRGPLYENKAVRSSYALTILLTMLLGHVFFNISSLFYKKVIEFSVNLY